MVVGKKLPLPGPGKEIDNFLSSRIRVLAGTVGRKANAAYAARFVDDYKFLCDGGNRTDYCGVEACGPIVLFEMVSYIRSDPKPLPVIGLEPTSYVFFFLQSSIGTQGPGSEIKLNLDLVSAAWVFDRGINIERQQRSLCAIAARAPGRRMKKRSVHREPECLQSRRQCVRNEKVKFVALGPDSF